MSASRQANELEVALFRHGTAEATSEATYGVELRFFDPASEAEIPAVRGNAALDLDTLQQLHINPDEYGETLTRALFDDSAVAAFFALVLTATETTDRVLRVRLRVGVGVGELHAVRWELLLDPASLPTDDGNSPTIPRRLATSERVLFSRFMASRDWRPVALRPKADLEALIAVSAPSDVSRFKLADVDRLGEIERAHHGLQGLTSRVLGDDAPLTLDRLVEALRSGVDVLYLVCHGMLKRSTGEPFVFLQQDDGTTARVPGAELAQRLAELAQPPRLVVLASCESGGTEDAFDAAEGSTAQSSLAPRLAEAGVSAVVAMQGKISMQTVAEAMPVFFRELLVDGRIDRAMAVARGSVRQNPDSWMPVLTSRLKGGRIWYEPGFAAQVDAFQKWKAILHSLHQGTFVPILGPNLANSLRGSYGDLAERLAEDHGFPLATQHRAKLSTVCQYLSVHQSRHFARDEFLRHLQEQLTARHPNLDVADLKGLFKAVLGQQTDDPFHILARLGGALYVCATPEPWLPLALAEAGTRPKVLASHWRKTKDHHPREPAYDERPSAETPLVHYPLGFVAKPESLVLTDDDYLDYLIAATNYDLMPRVVRGTLVKSTLLFLGFDFDDPAFRTLFRQIMALEGSAQLADFAHVGVQLDPAEMPWADVDGARRYLEGYFGSGSGAPRIDIYWGSASDFLSELQRQQEQAPAAPLPTTSQDEDDDDWVF